MRNIVVLRGRVVLSLSLCRVKFQNSYPTYCSTVRPCFQMPVNVTITALFNVNKHTSMSKKNKKPAMEESFGHDASIHASEYKIIKNDLLKVVILNAIYLVGVITLYATNNNSHYLERWFEKVVTF